jgi:hypothetical protein
VDPLVAIDDLHGPCGRVRDEYTTTPEVDVPVVELAGAMGRKSNEPAGCQPHPPLPLLGHMFLAPGV